MSLDDYGVAAPPAGLYDFGYQVTTGLDGFDALTDADIEQFHALGFLVIHNAIDARRDKKGAQRLTRPDLAA